MNKELLKTVQLYAFHLHPRDNKKVADKLKISEARLRQIKTGYRFSDVEKGKEMLTKIKNEYGKILDKKVLAIQKIRS